MRTRQPRMIWLLRQLRRDFPTWDRPAQIAFILAASLVIAGLIALLPSPQSARLPILGGIGGAILVMQVAALWGNRGMLSVYGRAQRLYLAADFVAARDAIETARAAGMRITPRTLTLLGNIYRQLGDLDASFAHLSEAVDNAPDSYFPYYGFGRTLMAMGRYDVALVALEQALKTGAPPVVQVDRLEALMRLGDHEAVQAALAALPSIEAIDPPRAAQVTFWRASLLGEPVDRDRLRAGLTYWQAQRDRFHVTPYGEALMTDLVQINEMLGD